MVHAVADESDYNGQLDAAGDKLVVIDFHAQWCPPCKLMGPYFEELSQEFPDVVFLKIDVDEVEEVASEFNISSIPKFVFLKNKQQVDEMLGTDHEKLKNMVLQHK